MEGVRKSEEKIMTSDIKKSKAPEPVGKYPHTRKVGNLLFLSGVGPRKPNTNTYHMYRNILWGLIKACEDAGKSAADAVQMMKTHSPDNF